MLEGFLHMAGPVNPPNPYAPISAKAQANLLRSPLRFTLPGGHQLPGDSTSS